MLKFLDFWMLYDNLMLFRQCFLVVAGVYFAENLNRVLGSNWKRFATQNYFDPHGVFLSALWSGPLLFIAIIILVSQQCHPAHHFLFLSFQHFWVVDFIWTLGFFFQVNTLFSLCSLIVRWKKAELRHRARVSHNKED